MFPDPATGILQVSSVKQRIESRPMVVKPSTIKWWPSFAGAARSGEMGFTTGPVIYPEGRGQGFIFTVWVKQADGRWKFYFDGGPATDTPTALTPQSPVETLAFAPRRAASAGAAKAEVAAVEAAIARAAAADSKAAYLPFLTATTRLMGSGIEPTTGAEAAGRELDRRGKAILFEPLGSLAARSGDLVFTYGRTLADGKIRGGYSRIWQNGRHGWRLVIDQIQVPPPPPPPPPAPAPAAAN
jgi:hypothetical protein